jgi:hypothetical protein
MLIGPDVYPVRSYSYSDVVGGPCSGKLLVDAGTARRLRGVQCRLATFIRSVGQHIESDAAVRVVFLEPKRGRLGVTIGFEASRILWTNERKSIA